MLLLRKPSIKSPTRKSQNDIWIQRIDRFLIVWWFLGFDLLLDRHSNVETVDCRTRRPKCRAAQGLKPSIIIAMQIVIKMEINESAEQRKERNNLHLILIDWAHAMSGSPLITASANPNNLSISWSHTKTKNSIYWAFICKTITASIIHFSTFPMCCPYAWKWCMVLEEAAHNIGLSQINAAFTINKLSI